MRFLFVLNRLPYPPRDGVTIPTFNWISRLSAEHHVSLLYINDKMTILNNQHLNKNKPYVENLWVLESSRLPASIRVKDELIGDKPFFSGWFVERKMLNRLLLGQTFDVVWGYNLGLAEIIESIYKILNPRPIFVSGMSDSNTAVLRSLGKRSIIKGLNLKTRILYFISWIRSWGIGRIETKMLKLYDLILLQTDIDKQWIDKISSGRLTQKTMAVSNGVNEDLFNLPVLTDGKDVLFLGILSNGYGKSLEWLMNNVWPKLQKECKNARLHVVGRGASDNLRMRMSEDSHITYREYIPNICDIFKNKNIMLSPVFKGYGLINKVVESMAAAVPVIGTADSFNGIPGFANGRHGIVTDSADSFIKEALTLLNNPMKRRDIADFARALVKKNFLWQDRINAIVDRIELIKSRKLR